MKRSTNPAMTCAEAGRLGGNALKAKREADFYAEIGRKGGQATRDKHGSAHYAAMGSIGGSTPKRARAVKSGGAA